MQSLGVVFKPWFISVGCPLTNRSLTSSGKEYKKRIQMHSAPNGILTIFNTNNSPSNYFYCGEL